MTTQFEVLTKVAANSPADGIALLKQAAELYGRELALCSSFSMEDGVVLHLLSQVTTSPRVIALDTGRLPEETIACAEQIRHRFNIEIEWRFPDAIAVEKLVQEKGLYSFRQSIENRKECCGIRKVVQLKQALAGLKGWVTGLRRAQSATRNDLSAVEVDSAHGGIIKLNPIVDWSYEQVLAYTKEHGIPYNRLYDQGFKSIGCAPCTRAIKPEEHERAGRWWWESPEHKECGIHLK